MTVKVTVPIPGRRVSIIRHSYGEMVYTNVWLFDKPGNEAVELEGVTTLSPGDIALVIAVMHESWVLLLTEDGHLGWTDELEGLKHE